jgi:enamine deaminase RidA (YjgF/YER057c/UK114 family)
MPKEVVYTRQLMRPIAHFSHAARVGGLVHVGATAGVHPDLRLAGESPGRIDAAAQIHKMFENLETALGLIGAAISDVVRIKTYLAFPRDVAIYRPIFDQRFSNLALAHTVIGSWDFPLPQAAVELDAVAVIGGGKASGAGGVIADGFHYAAATPVGPQGQTLGAGNMREQTSATLANLREKLDAAGLALRDVCNLHLTLRDIRDQAEIHTVLEEFFGIRLPACTIVGAPLERADFCVSIDSIAAKGGGEIIESEAVPYKATGFAPAMRSGDVLFLSGQTGLREDGHAGVQQQTELAWTRLLSLIEAAGFAEDSMVRTNNVLTDWRDYAAFNAGYGSHVREPYIPRATVLGTLCEPAARVQIEGIAHRHGSEATILQVPPPEQAG